MLPSIAITQSEKVFLTNLIITSILYASYSKNTFNGTLRPLAGLP